jgi:hypothetical protein
VENTAKSGILASSAAKLSIDMASNACYALYKRVKNAEKFVGGFAEIPAGMASVPIIQYHPRSLPTCSINLT